MVVRGLACGAGAVCGVGMAANSIGEETMRTFRAVAILVSGALWATASPAVAQTCAGLPMATGSTHLTGSVAFPMHTTDYGISFTQRATDDVAVGFGYTMSRYDERFGQDVPADHSVSVTAAYALGQSRTETGMELGLCPTVSVRHTSMDEHGMWTVPFGATLGAAYDVETSGLTFAPYFAPRMVWSRLNDSREGSVSDTRFQFVIGANVLVTSSLAKLVPGVSRIVLGAEFTRTDEVRRELALRFGLRF